MNVEAKTNVSAKKVFSRVGLAIAVTTIIVNLIQILLRELMLRFTPGIVTSGWAMYILIGVSFYLIGFPIFCAIVKDIPDGEKKESKSLSVGKIIVLFLISYFILIIVNLATNLLLYLVSVSKGGDVVNPLEVTVNNSSIIGTFLFVGILSPIVEEILFRGVMLNKLRGYGDKVAIITTALLFGLFHGNFSQFFYAVALGLVLAYVTLKTGTIKYSIILHIMINMMGSVIGMAVLNNSTAVMIFGVCVWVFVIAGLVLFIMNVKKIHLLPAENQIKKGEVFKTTCLNVGMILNFVINIALMIYILLI